MSKRKRMFKLYFSIRVLKAVTEQEAIGLVQDEVFLENHHLCDKVLTIKQLIKELLNPETHKIP